MNENNRYNVNTILLWNVASRKLNGNYKIGFEREICSDGHCGLRRLLAGQIWPTIGAKISMKYRENMIVESSSS